MPPRGTGWRRQPRPLEEAREDGAKSRAAPRACAAPRALGPTTSPVLTERTSAIWATKKKLKKPTVGPEDQYEVAEAFAAAARAVTRPSLRLIATTVVPACGAVLANGMFLASWPAVAQARTSKQLGALNPLPFAFTFANCLGWLHYGFVCRNHYVFWSNALGCVLGLLYTTTALKLGSVRKSTSASGRPGGIIYYSGRLDAARECLASSHEAS